MDFKTGGKKVIERLVEAYGFTTRQALCDHLGVSKSTLATRYMRDIFPAEWVIQCSIETGVSLKWLAGDDGPKYLHAATDVITLPHLILLGGSIHQSNSYFFDKALLPIDFQDPIAITSDNVVYIGTLSFNDITNGKWLIKFDNNNMIRDVIIIPGNKIIVNDGNYSFECNKNEIEKIALIKKILKSL